jgi:peptidoglycan/LPS O-acetylase OafA/YrhL
MQYIKQLDTVRAFAVFLVIIGHWLPPGNIVNIMPNGFMGVNIFFVLSGFLISKILFQNRIEAELLNIPRLKTIKQFYIRRTLRIFPIYYFSIFVLLIFYKTLSIDYTTAFVYLTTYTTNFYIFNIQYWPEYIGHLWSLAVEEQFYLIWPWLILFINKKYYLHLIIAFILTGVIAQYLTGNLKMNGVLTFNCFDAFGIGALLAWQMTFKPNNLKKFYIKVSVIAIASAILFFIGLKNNSWPYIPLRTIIAFISLWLITYIVINYNSNKLKLKFILNNKVLIWFGKISYGLYLYHNIIPETLNRLVINKYLNPLLPDFLIKKHWGLVFVAENTILLILISWLSYILIEKPFLNLKKHFKNEQQHNKLAQVNIKEYPVAK